MILDGSTVQPLSKSQWLEYRSIQMKQPVSQIERLDQQYLTDMPPSYGSTELIRQGEALFRLHCVRCHGESGDGAPVRHLDPAPRSLSGPSIAVGWVIARQRVLDNVFTSIRTGGRTGSAAVMPSFEETLSYEQMWAIVNYIEEM